MNAKTVRWTLEIHATSSFSQILVFGISIQFSCFGHSLSKSLYESILPALLLCSPESKSSSPSLPPLSSSSLVSHAKMAPNLCHSPGKLRRYISRVQTRTHGKEDLKCGLEGSVKVNVLVGNRLHDNTVWRRSVGIQQSFWVELGKTWCKHLILALIWNCFFCSTLSYFCPDIFCLRSMWRCSTYLPIGVSRS